MRRGPVQRPGQRSPRGAPRALVRPSERAPREEVGQGVHPILLKFGRASCCPENPSGERESAAIVMCRLQMVVGKRAIGP